MCTPLTFQHFASFFWCKPTTHGSWYPSGRPANQNYIRPAPVILSDRSVNAIYATHLPFRSSSHFPEGHSPPPHAVSGRRTCALAKILRPRLLLPPAFRLRLFWAPSLFWLRSPKVIRESAVGSPSGSRFPRSPRRLPFLPVPSLLDRWAALQWTSAWRRLLRPLSFLLVRSFQISSDVGSLRIVKGSETVLPPSTGGPCFPSSRGCTFSHTASHSHCGSL